MLFASPSALGSADCSSWANACDLQTALASADSTDQIWVQAGVHKPTTISDRTTSFALQPEVALYGGFLGTEDDLSERDWEANLTVLSGDIDGNDTVDSNGVTASYTDIVGDNSYHVVTAGESIYQSAVLDGFIITAGLANSSSPDNKGGGIYNLGGDPTLSNLILSGNQAVSSGGGMYSEGLYSNGSAPTLTGVAFKRILGTAAAD